MEFLPPVVRRFSLWLLGVSLVLLPAWARAQNPELGPSDLAYSQRYASNRRLVARVSLQTPSKESVQYRYERSPGVARIVLDQTEYGQVEGRGWLRSTDWGQSGDPVQEPMARQLDFYAEMAQIPWAESTHTDPSQGDAAWKLKTQAEQGRTIYYTYERTRERPKPNAFYPLFSFARRANDTEGRLLLVHFRGNVRQGEDLLPVEIDFDYLAPAVPGTADLSSYETWITGQAILKQGTLMFQADKPVQGNAAGNLVLLGADKTTAKVLLPLYMRAAEKHVRQRLYGVLLPVEKTPSKRGFPSVQFITWKVHSPEDPDELPLDQRISIGEGDEIRSDPPPREKTRKK